MINSERLEQAIAVMKRAGEVNMNFWQRGVVSETEDDLHTCGNSACFAGWLAVSPEFREAGGTHLSNSGAPIFDGYTGYYAISEWLEAEGELHKEVIELLVAGEAVISDATEEWLMSKNIPLEPEKHYTLTCLKGWIKYKAQDVIKILEALHD